MERPRERRDGRAVFPDHAGRRYRMEVRPALAFLDSSVFRAQAVPYDWVPEGTLHSEKPVAEIDATNYFVSLDRLEIGSASPRLSASVVSHAETRKKTCCSNRWTSLEWRGSTTKSRRPAPH